MASHIDNPSFFQKRGWDSKVKVSYSLDNDAGLYCHQLQESWGFDVDDFPKLLLPGKIQPMGPLTDHDRELLNPLAVLATDYYNEKENTNFEFVRVLKANAEVVCGCNFYITFEAKDAADSQTKTFQAVVLLKILDEGSVVRFCRLWPASTSQEFGGSSILAEAMDIDD